MFPLPSSLDPLVREGAGRSLWGRIRSPITHPPTSNAEYINCYLFTSTMGFFSSSSTPEPKQDEMRKKSTRQLCWDARDKYFACLDKHDIDNDIIDPKPAQKHCKAEDDVFQQQCISSWVKYFRERRINDIKKNRRIAELEKDGAIKVEFDRSFK